MSKDYFIGLDIGSDSIGWAVTDPEYNLIKVNGKAMWGIHLFNGAETSAQRRFFRCARRRQMRKVQRIALLRELFNDEIMKIDSGFFERLDDSFFWAEDKREKQKNTLFNDKDYSDKDYHKAYPTIYHLRKALVDGEKPKDLRLLYLAIAHILKNRGHFLFEGQDLGAATDFQAAFSGWRDMVEDSFGENLYLTDTKELEEILKTKMTINDKKRKVGAIFSVENPRVKSLINLMAGATEKFSNIFDDEALKDADISSISFAGSTFDEKKDEIAGILGDENMYVLEMTKALYDWGILADILKGEKSISYAKTKVYEKHKEDLAILKKVIKEYIPEKYDTIFKRADVEYNYPSYVGMAMKSGKKKPLAKSICTQEEFCKFILGHVKTIDAVNEDVEYLKKELELKTLMPKQSTKDNSVIPSQINLYELEKILENAAGYYEFLNNEDAYGTVAGKIIDIFKFKIPYYVGPLNNSHKEYAWVERKTAGRVTPWNFDEMVDEEKSAEQFILRMTNKCTYLFEEPVLPKNSILYSKYMMLNELNNLRINGEKISAEQKKTIINELFMKQSRVTQSSLKGLFKTEYGIKNIEISGIDGDFKANMKSYLDLKKCIGDKAENREMAEELIRLLTIFGEGSDMFARKVTKIYSDMLTPQEIKKLSRLKYSGWGRFSEKLLTGIYTVDNETGEYVSIISMMENTDENFMQILYNEKYDFLKQIKEYEKEHYTKPGTYESLQNLYISPANRKRIWRSLVIVKEIVKIMGGEPPKKFFIEMARGPEEEQKNKRTVSRKEQLESLYKACKEDKELLASLGNETEGSLRAKKLYLYYMQLGRCMYSGKRLEISDLINCDIDHIIPQSVKKDDSFENTVLVERTLNAKKKDYYPIPREILSEEARNHWKLLLDKKFISKEKYNRLCRMNPLTENEKADFVARQLVDTRQTTKEVADILKKIYQDKTEIVYAKAKNVSEFRNGAYVTKEEQNSGEFSDDKLIKVREINDYHHAKDAYLNIVVGNVYNEKFQHNPLNYIKGGGNYNLARMFDFDVKDAWKKGQAGTIVTVKNTLRKNNVMFTRYAFEERGGLYKVTIRKKGEGQFPIKNGDARLHNIERYGGYDSVTGAYFVLVQHTVKKKTVKTIEHVPVYLVKAIENGRTNLEKYFMEKGLEDVKVLLPKIKINTLFIVDGFPMHVTGRMNDRLLFSGALQLCIDEQNEKYIKKIVSYMESTAAKAKYSLPPDHNGINKDENILIYEMFMDKLNNSPYKIRLSKQYLNLKKGKATFEELELADQNKVLFEILKFFGCNRTKADLKLIGASGSLGDVNMGKDISKCKSAKIINQSPTGFFRQEIDLLSL